ncbi:hypothetical protein [Arenibacter palladensis]|uniref:hypothetical protein n=1 Tax=Arenibacter palladensis TaxID=237373 RepID=UPI0026E16085|nr:hypothetical protein [Arenibacter palladensis]MDO6603179.1 hypothetical protein [Arenibacter palladensis]
MLDKDFSSDWYSAILGNLRDNDYLTQSDVDVLLKDSLEDHSIVLSNIDQEMAEIVRNALLENSKGKKFK